MIKEIMRWISDHRYIFLMNPKGWTEQDEIEYQKFAWKHGDIRGYYQDKIKDEE